MIYINGKEVRAAYLGRNALSSIYQGAIKIWEAVQKVWRRKDIWKSDQHLGQVSLESILQFIEELAQSGTKLICIDHALFLVRSAKESDEHIEVCRQLAMAAGKYKMHIILVAQAPKLIDGTKLGIDTVYGGVAAAMFAHNFITLQRDKTNDDVLEVRLVACRYPNSRPSYEPVILSYDRESCKLID